MAKRVWTILFLGLIPMSAADIEGTVVIKHKLTKKKVTASGSTYDRGIAVAASTEPVMDPLAFERTHVVIWVEDETAPRESGETAVIEQVNRQFVPDLVVIPAGSSVSFPNLDPIFHNVFSLSKPKSFDLGSYPKGQTRKVTFAKPGIVFVNCHLHPNMSAAIVITPNRWNTKPDAAGHFVLRNVSAGEKTIVAWHKSAGFFRKTVKANEQRPAAVTFEIPLDENGAVTARSVALR